MVDCSAESSPAPYLRLLRLHNPGLGRPRTASNRGEKARTPSIQQRQLVDDAQERRKASVSSAPMVGSTADAESPPVPAAGHGSPCSPGAAAAKGLVELAATEQCPHCSRRFSREAAARHVPICAGLRSRPKPPMKETMTYVTDALGRRHGSRPATGSKEVMMRMNTPTRSLRPRSAADSLDGTTPTSKEDKRGVLSRQWDLVQFLLRDGLEALADDASIMATMKSVEACLNFLNVLEEHAQNLNIRKGALSRMLLPFDLETNSGDQASSALEAPLGSRELQGLISDVERKELVAQAVELRRLIRIKVADCADVEQARESLKLTSSFLTELHRRAEEENRTLTSLLREL